VESFAKHRKRCLLTNKKETSTHKLIPLFENSQQNKLTRKNIIKTGTNTAVYNGVQQAAVSNGRASVRPSVSSSVPPIDSSGRGREFAAERRRLHCSRCATDSRYACSPRLAANAGSVMSRTEGRGSAYTCVHVEISKQRKTNARRTINTENREIIYTMQLRLYRKYVSDGDSFVIGA